MGLEAKCVARYKGHSGPGTAMLESDGILYRGAFRLFIPAADLKAAKIEDGSLVTSVGGEAACLELGPVANDWLRRILNPKTLLEKLGVKSGMEISVLGAFDEVFNEQLSTAAGKVSFGKLRPGSDVLFLAVKKKADLDSLSKGMAALKPRGVAWIIYPKGVQVIRESDVSAAAKSIGLVANKVVSFSPSQTGLRFVAAARK